MMINIVLHGEIHDYAISNKEQNSIEDEAIQRPPICLCIVGVTRRWPRGFFFGISCCVLFLD